MVGVTIYYSAFNILVVLLAFPSKMAFHSDGEIESAHIFLILCKNTLETTLPRDSNSVPSIVLQKLLSWNLSKHDSFLPM